MHTPFQRATPQSTNTTDELFPLFLVHIADLNCVGIGSPNKAVSLHFPRQSNVLGILLLRFLKGGLELITVEEPLVID